MARLRKKVVKVRMGVDGASRTCLVRWAWVGRSVMSGLSVAGSLMGFVGDVCDEWLGGYVRSESFILPYRISPICVLVGVWVEMYRMGVLSRT